MGRPPAMPQHLAWQFRDSAHAPLRVLAQGRGGCAGSEVGAEAACEAEGSTNGAGAAGAESGCCGGGPVLCVPWGHHAPPRQAPREPPREGCAAGPARDGVREGAPHAREGAPGGGRGRAAALRADVLGARLRGTGGAGGAGGAPAIAHPSAAAAPPRPASAGASAAVGAGAAALAGAAAGAAPGAPGRSRRPASAGCRTWESAPDLLAARFFGTAPQELRRPAQRGPSAGAPRAPPRSLAHPDESASRTPAASYLRLFGLGQYAGGFNDAGLGDLGALAKLRESEAVDLAEQLPLYPGHRARLLRALGLLRQAAALGGRQQASLQGGPPGEERLVEQLCGRVEALRAERAREAERCCALQEEALRLRAELARAGERIAALRSSAEVVELEQVKAQNAELERMLWAQTEQASALAGQMQQLVSAAGSGAATPRPSPRPSPRLARRLAPAGAQEVPELCPGGASPWAGAAGFPEPATGPPRTRAQTSPQLLTNAQQQPPTRNLQQPSPPQTTLQPQQQQLPHQQPPHEQPPHEQPPDHWPLLPHRTHYAQPVPHPELQPQPSQPPLPERQHGQALRPQVPPLRMHELEELRARWEEEEEEEEEEEDAEEQDREDAGSASADSAGSASPAGGHTSAAGGHASSAGSAPQSVRSACLGTAGPVAACLAAALDNRLMLAAAEPPPDPRCADVEVFHWLGRGQRGPHRRAWTEASTCEGLTPRVRSSSNQELEAWDAGEPHHGALGGPPALPSRREIEAHLSMVLRACHAPPEVAVIALVYLNRFAEQCEGWLTRHTWQSVSLVAILSASKVWDDDPFDNAEFAQIVPTPFDAEGFDCLERTFLECLNYNIIVSEPMYNRAQFLLETVRNKDGGFAVPQITPERAAVLEEESTKRQTELMDYLETLRPRSPGRAKNL